MLVREARPDEAALVVGLYPLLFAPPGGPPPTWDPVVAEDRVRALLEADDATVLLAEVEGTVAGFGTIALDIRSVRYGQRAWVEDLAVDPSFRSQGAGKALLDALKDWAVTHGATHLELDSGDGRLDAHRFYEREQPSWTARSFGWWLG
jgi:GNAT superfamily N-acetyltransferase